MGRRNKRNRQSRLPKETQPRRVRLNFELKKVSYPIVATICSIKQNNINNVSINSADMSGLELPKNAKLIFPQGSNHVMDFELILVPDEGIYRDGMFLFSFQVPQSYPHDPPKVKCLTKVFHPNIDVEGNVCLNILREDWSPVLSISSVIYGLLFLLLDPNPDDPLNKNASTMMQTDRAGFEQVVRGAVRRGMRIGGVYFPPAQGTKTV